MRRGLVGATAAAALLLSGCSDASVGRYNIDKAADQFEVPRRILFINGITDKVLFNVEGMCSYEVEEEQVVVLCQVDESGELYKHSMIRSDNVTVASIQLDGVGVDYSRHRVIVKPEAVIPDIDVEFD